MLAFAVLAVAAVVLPMLVVVAFGLSDGTMPGNGMLPGNTVGRI